MRPIQTAPRGVNWQQEIRDEQSARSIPAGTRCPRPECDSTELDGGRRTADQQRIWCRKCGEPFVIDRSLVIEISVQCDCAAREDDPAVPHQAECPMRFGGDDDA